MNTNDNGRAEARSRANRRLRRMTIGTTVLGLAATGSLGWLAAATYSGATAADAASAIVAVGTGGSATSGTTNGTATPTATAAPVASAAPIVTTTTGNAHAASGGS
jgi:hypothetical protein